MEMFGWLGLLAVLAAFGLVSAGLIEGRSYTFQLLSLTGSIALGAISVSKKAYQPAALNVILATIAVITIISLLLD